MPNHPTLRPLDFRPVHHRGDDMWLLHDPLRLSPYQLILPPALAQLALLCDGSRTVEEIERDLGRRIGAPVSSALVADTLAQLDEACLLANGRAGEAIQAQLAAYRRLPARPAAFADQGYPAEASALRRALAAYSPGAHGDEPSWCARGVISPHIDYDRGGPVYAATWRRAARAAREADLVLFFGTDHTGSQPITLTRVPYETPFGRLPLDGALVDRLATTLGEQAFADELNHRHEHSVELSAVWWHYARGAVPAPPVLPVLVGSFHRFLINGSRPTTDAYLNRFLAALEDIARQRRVLAVASVDLAHVGPHFGDRFVMDAPRRRAREAADRALMATIAAGDAEGFYDAIAAVNDRDRICGFAPIYLLLRFLSQTSGVVVDYAQAAADAQDHSLVSFCGMLLK